MVKTGRKTFKACRGCRSKRARCNGQKPCGRCRQLGTPCIYENRQLETKDLLRDERTALQAHDAAFTLIIRALVNGEHEIETIIALWRGKPVEDIAEALSALRLGSEHDDDILGRFSQQELRSLLSAGPGAFASERNAGDASCGDGSSSSPLASASVDRFGSAAEQYLGGRARTDSYLSSPGETRTFAGTQQRGRGWGFGGTSPMMPQTTDDTTPQSQFYGSDSHSPILEKNDRVHFDAPVYFNQAEQPGRVGSGTSSQRHSHIIDFGGESRNEKDMKVMPFELTHELLEMFFQEQYTPFPTIAKDLFWDDFMAGNKDYCSIALVRIMCCLACRIRHGYDLGPEVSLGNQLWDEASRLIRTVNSENSIPNAQALGLMSLHQLGAGQYESAQALADEGVARLAQLFADLDQEIQLKNSVQATTLYGAIALARMIRLTIAHSTPLSNNLDGLSVVFTPKEPAETVACVEQLLSNTGLNTIAQADGGLYQRPAIAFQLTDWIYGCISRSQVAVDGGLSAHVRDTYRACLDWYHSTLKQGGGIEDAGPFIHMYHHFCLLTLFRPFCHVNSEDIVPAEICRESADSILCFTQICSQLEDFRLPCFVPLFIYAAGTVDSDIFGAGDDYSVESGQTRAQHARDRCGSTTSHESGGSSLSAMLGDGETARRSLANRALEQLTQLSDIYPSARKAALDLQSAMGRRVSMSAVGD